MLKLAAMFAQEQIHMHGSGVSSNWKLGGKEKIIKKNNVLGLSTVTCRKSKTGTDVPA